MSVKRIEKFLLEPDINKSFVTHDTFNTRHKHYAVRMRNGNFYWKDIADSHSVTSEDSSISSSSSNDSSGSDIS